MGTEVERARPKGSGIVFGVALMAIGLLLTFESLDVIGSGPIHRWWPLVVVAMGAGKVYETWGTTESGSGLTLLLSGLWFLAVNLKIWGLTWRNSWSLLLVVVGIGMVLRSLLVRGPVRCHGEEARNDR